jgi:hypothetical protein
MTKGTFHLSFSNYMYGGVQATILHTRLLSEKLTVVHLITVSLYYATQHPSTMCTSSCKWTLSWARQTLTIYCRSSLIVGLFSFYAYTSQLLSSLSYPDSNLYTILSLQCMAHLILNIISPVTLYEATYVQGNDGNNSNNSYDPKMALNHGSPTPGQRTVAVCDPRLHL